MSTQVSFTTEEELKNRALEKAKSEGITLKALLVGAMKDFVDGKISFGIITHRHEPDVEEIVFDDKRINKKAAVLAQLLK